MQIGYHWKPIEDLPDDWRVLASSELAGLFAVWKDHVVRLKDSPAYQEFQVRLRREWAIETGIIEGLYDIDRGVTRTLIERGLHASLIAHGDANKPAEEIIPMLKDHEAVVEGLFDFVGQKRQLSTSYIKQIHQAITTHQETVPGIDSLGRKIEIPLLRGEWKKRPNNPTRPDGKVHEYCPPEQVASEMDRLIEMHMRHLEEGVSPEQEAVWLHHRFVQIHPFQDGNGRVARALASLVFIRAGWFPFVVHRDDRTEYIACLEKADAFDMSSLTRFFESSQKKAFNQAMTFSPGVLLPTDSIEQIISSGERFLREKEEAQRLLTEKLQALHHQYQKIAVTLQEITQQRFHDIRQSFENTFQNNIQIETPGEPFGPLANLAYRKWGAEIANKLECNADTWADGWGASFRILRKKMFEIHFCFCPLVNSNWRIACGLAYFSREGEAAPYLLSAEPFQCAISEEMDAIVSRYKQWIEDALRLGLAEWRRKL